MSRRIQIQTTPSFVFLCSAMRTDYWGPSGWTFAHALTWTYPTSNPSPEDRQSAIEFFRSLKRRLPCAECRKHYSAMYDADPVDAHLDSRDALVRWLVNKHNLVNERLKKPTVSFEQVVAHFQALEEGGHSSVHGSHSQRITPPEPSSPAGVAACDCGSGSDSGSTADAVPSLNTASTPLCPGSSTLLLILAALGALSMVALCLTGVLFLWPRATSATNSAGVGILASSSDARGGALRMGSSSTFQRSP